LFGNDVLFLALLCGALIGFLCLRIVSRKGREKFNDVDWCRQNKWKLVFFCAVPMIGAIAPVIEETLFRAPLIILFSALMPAAWATIVLSSLLFSVLHVGGLPPYLLGQKVFENEKSAGKKVAEATEGAGAENRGMVIGYRITRTIFAFSLGLVAGWLGVKYQSIYPCLIVHAGWNLFCLSGLNALLMVLLLVVIMLPVTIYNRIRGYLRYRKMRKGLLGVQKEVEKIVKRRRVPWECRSLETMLEPKKAD
jgi:membrane protease YdiL (CAAX protease family)